MTKPPAYQYYPADFDMDTASWTNEEVGAYQRLLNYAWLNRGVPNDTWRLATIVRTPIEYFEGRLWPTIAPKWIENGHGNLINSRQEKERAKQEKYRQEQSEAGKRGVEAKKEKGAFPFDQIDNQATLNSKIKQPLIPKSSNPSSQNQGSLVEKSSSSSSSLNTTTRKEEELPKGGPSAAQRGPLGKLLDSDPEFKKAFDEARKYFPDIGAWFGKSFKKYGDIAIAQNSDELLATMQAIAKKKQFDGDPWGYALKTFLGKVRDKDLAEQGQEKKWRMRHIKDLYKNFKGKGDDRSAPHRDPP